MTKWLTQELHGSKSSIQCNTISFFSILHFYQDIKVTLSFFLLQMLNFYLTIQVKIEI